MTPTEKIDDIDAKILKDLLVDGRKNFIEIATDAKVTKDVIWQHYSNMKRKGIIIGATTQLNYAYLGYDVAASFFIRIPPQQRGQTIEQLRKIPGLYDAYQCGSPSILWTVSDFTKTREIENIKASISRIPSILGSEMEIWTSIRNRPENLSVLNNTYISSELGNREVQTKHRIEGDSKGIRVEINDIDRQIIEKLSVDGRVSFNAIGKELGTSTSTAIRRYRNLKRNGILKVLIQVDTAKLGYYASAIFRLRICSEEKMKEIIQKITKIPDVNGIMKTLGLYDLTLITKIKNFEHLSNMETEISSIEGIREMAPTALCNFPILPYPREHISTF